MESIQTYVQRLIGVGYDERYAKKLVDFYRDEGSLEGLEEYIETKEQVLRR